MLLILALWPSLIAPHHWQNEVAGVDAEPAGVAQLERMVGNWQGGGWIQQARREEFTGREVVQKKAGGTVLVIEGLHHAKLEPQADQQPPVVVHDAMAVIWFDKQLQELRMHAFTQRGDHTQCPVKVDGETVQWGFQRGPMHVRFTITIQDNQWVEIGEISQDQKAWRQFFEMKLKRDPEARGE